MYDRFTENVMEQAHSHALKASGELLRGPVEQALVHRMVQASCSALRAELASLSGDLPRTAEPQVLLWELASILERDAYPEPPNAAAMHWLGEQWIDDPLGLKSAHGSTDAGRTKAYDPKIFDRLFSGIKDIFDRIADDVTPGSGNEWLKNAFERCAGDADAMEALSELRAIADRGRPRIHLVGDYSSGKTSFIKRLLIDAGSPVTETLEVRANPTTDTPREYDWDGVTLIDTPGFQTSEAAHTKNAFRALADASAVLYLFQPNLIVGEDEYMTTVIRGRKDRGMIPRQQYTFFIVNRSDELGVDPADDPDAYGQLVERKKTELSLALRSRNIAVASDRVCCMASDPYGLVGNRTDVDASAFNPYRNWDGFRQFTRAFRRAKAKLLRSGVDRSILGGALARLANLQAREQSIVAKLEAQERALERLQGQIDDFIAEGERLGAKHRADLHRLVWEQAAGFRDEVLGEQDHDLLQEAADRLNVWWTDKALQHEVGRWASATSSTLNSWRERCLEAIERRFQSTEFRAVFGDHREDAPELTSANKASSVFAKAVGKSGNILSKASRNTVYQVGKALRVKFKPGGAVKLAGKLGKVSVVLSTVGFALDIADLFLEERRYLTREKERKKIASFLQESVPRVVEAFAFGDVDDPGILKDLEGVIESLKTVAGDQRGKRENLSARMNDAHRKLTSYAELMSDASRRLGDPWEVL